MTTPYVEPYPRWYTPVKWLAPMALALFSGTLVCGALMGFVPIPMALGKLAWLPAIYKSLETAKAVGVLVGSFSLVSSFVAVSAAFILRATVLFHENEKRGTQAQLAQQHIDKQNELISKMTIQLEYLSNLKDEHSEDDIIELVKEPIIPSKEIPSELDIASNDESGPEKDIKPRLNKSNS